MSHQLAVDILLSRGAFLDAAAGLDRIELPHRLEEHPVMMRLGNVIAQPVTAR